MFDSESLEVCLNSMYEAGVCDDMLAPINEANLTNEIAVKTPNCPTERKTIKNKTMQGDVLGPLMSSNMVDKHIGKEALKNDIVYMY